MSILDRLNAAAGVSDEKAKMDENAKRKKQRNLLLPQKGEQEEEKSSTEKATDSIRKAFGGK